MFVTTLLTYSACVEDGMTMNSAPCEWEATFLSVPDTCFDLPRNPNGSIFTAPHGPSYSFQSPMFNPLIDGSFYYVKLDQPDFDEIQLIRKNLCPFSTDPELSLTLPGFGGMKINQNGNLLFLTDQQTLVYYNVYSNTIDTILANTIAIDLFWIDRATCAVSVYIEESNDFRYVAYDTSGVVMDTLSLDFGNTSNQNDAYFAFYYSSGSIQIFSTETLELVRSISRPHGFNGAIRTTWIDNERLLLLETKKLSLLNIETEEEQVLLDYSGCENIGFYSVTSDPFDHDRILISRFDHYLNENGQLRREERISYYNITTGEEQILELE